LKGYHWQEFLLGLGVWVTLAGAAWAQSEAPDPNAPVLGAAALPRDLTPWGMFMSAHPVVKGVIIGLALASIVTWTIWLAKTIELLGAKRKLRAAIGKLSSAVSLSEAQRAGTSGPAAEFIAAALAEVRMSADAPDKDGLKERIASRLERIEAAYGRKISRSTGVLATIGATAPFVGLGHHETCGRPLHRQQRVRRLRQ
jgi:biopolymer transport protein ExbB